MIFAWSSVGAISFSKHTSVLLFCLLLHRVMRQILVDKIYSICQKVCMQRQGGHWHIYEERLWHPTTSSCECGNTQPLSIWMLPSVCTFRWTTKSRFFGVVLSFLSLLSVYMVCLWCLVTRHWLGAFTNSWEGCCHQRSFLGHWPLVWCYPTTPSPG